MSDQKKSAENIVHLVSKESAQAHVQKAAKQAQSVKESAIEMEKTAAEKIAQEWLDASALTATNRDFDAHFALISEKVRVTGVPGFDSISYDDWARAAKKDFEDKVLESVSYEGLKLNAQNDKQIMFKTLESIFVNDGTKKTQGVEILIELEADGVWRVIQERVMTGDEIRHVGLLPH